MPTVRLSQHDHREMSYRRLLRWGMDEDAALRAAYSLRWDEDGHPVDDDDFDCDFGGLSAKQR